MEGDFSQIQSHFSKNYAGKIGASLAANSTVYGIFTDGTISMKIGHSLTVKIICVTYVTGFRKTDHIVTIDIARNTDLKY